MTVLITLTQAKAHLRVEHDDDNSDMLLKAADASDIVVNYIKNPDHGWSDRTVPGDVRSAVLLVFEHLYNRSPDDPLSPAVKSLLHRYRDPALA